MKIKEGVSISGIQPEIVLALLIANDVYQTHGVQMTVTSLLDGKHMRASLHYVGAAADLGIAFVEANVVAEEIRERLRENYDVVLEPNHIHVEFQPKVGA